MDEDSKNTTSLSKQAITAALSYNWEEAVALNKEIIKQAPEDIECLNRLARALFELGKYLQAKKIYQSVLKIDPYNSIAQKNLKRVSSFKTSLPDGVKLNGIANAKGLHLSPALFLQEPGVTKIVNLIKLAEPQKLSVLSPGLMVNLTLKNRGITVTDLENNYLGVLPDDIAHLLIKLIKGGNRYQALIKSVNKNSLSILIREIFRSRKSRNQPSFLDEGKSVTFSSDHISLALDDNEETSFEETSDSDGVIN